MKTETLNEFTCCFYSQRDFALYKRAFQYIFAFDYLGASALLSYYAIFYILSKRSKPAKK